MLAELRIGFYIAIRKCTSDDALTQGICHNFHMYLKSLKLEEDSASQDVNTKGQFIFEQGEEL